MPPVLLVLEMPSNCSAPVRCPTVAIALPTEVIANALRLHWAQAPHQSLLIAIVSVCEVDVYHEPEEAGKTTRHCLSPLKGLRTVDAYLTGYWRFIAVAHQPHTPPRTHARRTSVSVGPSASDWHMPGGHRRGLRTAARR